MNNSKLDKKISQLLKNKTILITGGTGSFGKTIVNRLTEFPLKEIRIFSRSEDKQHEMQFNLRTKKNLLFILGDVRDFSQINRAVKGVDYVIHAAAQKQVPGTEYNVLEGIKTNILGAQNVIDSSIINNVKKAVAISTDKAVEPVNTMGMTKALQERLFINANILPTTNKTAFSCVRYGNVLGSTGSVLPLFQKLINQNTDLTLTDKEMTRFIITLEEAVQLVLISLLDSVGGETYVPDLPSHSILDLAEVLIDITGNRKIKIVTTGIRIGEKIHETLVSPTESLRTIRKKGYFIVLPPLKIDKINKKYKLPKDRLMNRYSSDSARRVDKIELKKIVEYFLNKNSIINR